MSDPKTIPSKIAVIIVAAGRGTRAGLGGPKQYRDLVGKPVIVRTLNVFLDAFSQSEHAPLIVPVIHEDDQELYLKSVEGLSGLHAPVIGGTTRQQSVRNALESLSENEPEYVLIHDAARPFLSKKLVKELLAALKQNGGGFVPALPIVDSLVRQAETLDYNIVKRDGLFAIQTPQAFRFNEILSAHRAAIHENYTDDASVLVADGGTVAFVEGPELNFKITTPADFKKAERYISAANTDVRVGSGYDVHRFEGGNAVWLGGIEIPYNKKLKGHSDADVALHALTDAVLASIADGDIGVHFPPSDNEWRGAPSDKFLSFACDRVRARGGILNMLSLTIVCEGPKIGPHSNAMRNRIADIAGIDVSRVSVQATTTEKLGFTGRSEGIAAQATATVCLPPVKE